MEVNGRMSNSEKHVPRTDHKPTLLNRLSRYDLLLWSFPILFGVAIGTAALSQVPGEIALLAASVAGALLMIEGLFRNPPVPTDE